MKATVAILTFNASEYIEEVLKACFEQEVDFDYEVLVVDSGSTDGTLEILHRFPDVRLHQIPNTEFGHGKTRNLAADLAKGEIVVYITHDATPAHKFWLKEIVRPFDLSSEVAAVLGNQIPRDDCCPTVKRDVKKLFASLGPSYALTFNHKSDYPLKIDKQHAITFYSDTNSAARKSILKKIPYQDVNYSEDQAFGIEIIEAGYYKVFNPYAAVRHSHSYPPVTYFRRMYDEMMGLKRATGQTLETSRIRHILIMMKGILGDWNFTLRDKDYSPGQKLKWMLQIPAYNLFRRLAIRLSARKRLPGWADSMFSLEARQKKVVS